MPGNFMENSYMLCAHTSESCYWHFLDCFFCLLSSLSSLCSFQQKNYFLICGKHLQTLRVFVEKLIFWHNCQDSKWLFQASPPNALINAIIIVRCQIP